MYVKNSFSDVLWLNKRRVDKNMRVPAMSWSGKECHESNCYGWWGIGLLVQHQTEASIFTLLIRFIPKTKKVCERSPSVTVKIWCSMSLFPERKQWIINTWPFYGVCKQCERYNQTVVITQLISSPWQCCCTHGGLHSEVPCEKQNSNGSTATLQPCSVINRLLTVPKIES